MSEEVKPTAAASRYESRKFRAFLLVLGLGAGMELAGKLSPQLAELMKWSLAIYCGFNVTQKAAEWVATVVSKGSMK